MPLPRGLGHNGYNGTEVKMCYKMHFRQLLPADQKLGWNVAGVTEYNSL